ncbi:hypothetical protein D9619_013003 [Psilocybe cf. subviscida]|uniref:Uncharacterized protein n=1 Tax=Psilocybe cf. subviscida TaxID=2480587 RepID=A0A8H5AZI6_9AGAR|nr:hypothetical protein D9619_013003 [Psilocybe cf. subviscida]
MALAQALQKLSQSDADSSAQDKTLLRDSICQCVSAAAPQWEWSIRIDSAWTWRENELVTTENATTKRICEIVVVCYTIDHLQPCINLFNSLCQYEPDTYITGRLRQIHLRTTLAGLSKPFNVEPFTSFYKNSIFLYLARVLGGKPTMPFLPSNAVGCGCADCTQLDTFLRGSEVVTSFKATHLRRSHVEAQIRKDRLYLKVYQALDNNYKSYKL